ncbi:MAG: alcohol dehydrogenase catalytic domain-containing protein [Bacteroidota bacterium]
MKALTFTGVESVTIETIPDPEIIHEQDVIVRVKTCAICGSDLHVYHGREKGIDLHTAMGHEFAGEVVAKGRGVKSLAIGDLVMSPFTTSCGDCYFCNIGLTCRCTRGQLFGWVENGKGLHGGQAEFVRVPLAESTLMKIPDGLGMELAVMLGDIIPTGFFCAKQGQGKVVGVAGCGPVGLMAVLGADYYGAERIYAFDSVPERLAMAASFGAIPVDIRANEFRPQMREATAGIGVDAMLEAVGSSAALKMCYDLVRPGGTVSAVGVCTDAMLPFSPTDAYNKNLTYKTGRCPARHLMPELLPLLLEGRYGFERIITDRIGLGEGEAGYRKFAAREGNCLKVIVEV